MSIVQVNLLEAMENYTKNGEKGFTFVATILAVVVIGIVSSTVITLTSTTVKREKEEELIHRLNLVRPALKTYRIKMNRYPSHLDELLTNKYIRKFCLTDPITGKEWELVYASISEGFGIKDIKTTNSEFAMRLKESRKVKLNEL